MKLLIVESPSKAKTIEKYLGGAFTVRASVGHVRDLPKSNKKAIDIEGGFIPHYEISKGKERIVAELRHLADKADEILLATDPDREGEAIAWHIAQATDLKRPKRVVFHEITKEAVIEALEHPRDIDDNLKQAQEARRVLDRLVGYDLSGLIWNKVRYGLSAGRVQSPALRIVMEREREIRAFISDDYFTLTVNTEAKGMKIPFICNEEPGKQAEAVRIKEIGESSTWVITDLKESEAKRSPRPPFTTSTLQQTASTRLGFSPSRTMGAAQKLYEAGHITYMRTDSPNLSSAAQKQILALLHADFGESYVMPRTYKSKSKSAQEAHEAVRPTNFAKRSVGSTGDQKALYELIWKRAVASQMADATMKRSKLITNITDTKKTIPDFAVNGSRVVFDGWLKVDTRARGEDTEVPKLAVGDAVAVEDIVIEAKETEPPNRYTEAGLIKELEKRGIGRQSTYASITKTIVDRGYVNKEGKTLIPTDTGDVVSTFLEANFSNYISDTFTASMEEDLDDIALGKKEYVKTLSTFYKPFLKDVKEKDKTIGKITNMGDVEDIWKCPTCNGPMVWKLSKNGKFMSCAKFPDCAGARTNSGEEMKGPVETGEKCPLCGDLPVSKTAKLEGGKLVERQGRFGTFIACSRYPKCKFIKEYPDAVKRSD